MRQDLRDLLSRIQQKVGVSRTYEARLNRWLSDDSDWPTRTTLVHGDLYVGHTLVDPSEKITAVIDWSEAKFSDAAIDFTGHLQALGEVQLERALQAYAQRGGRAWPRMFEHIVERSLASPLRAAEYALRTGNDELLGAVRQQLRSEID